MGKRFNRKKRRFLDDKAENDELNEDEVEEDEIEDNEVDVDEAETGEIEDNETYAAEETEADKEMEVDETETGDENEEMEADEAEAGDENEEMEDDEAEDDNDEVEVGEEYNETEDDKLEVDEEDDDETEEEKTEVDESDNKIEDNEVENDKDDEPNYDEEVSLDEAASEKVDRRVFRHRRRVRNQIIAYGVMTVCLAALIAAGIFAGLRISDYVKTKRQAEELAKRLEQQLEEQQQQEQQQQEENQTGLIIETPPADIIVEEPTLEEQLDEIVNKCISEMPLEDKVASLFIITPEALTGVRTVTRAGDSTQEALSKYAVGGLIYFSHNIISKEQLTEMLSKTVLNSKYPIFLAVDEEGGSVSRVANSNIEVVKVDDMAVIGTSGDAVAAHEAGNTIGTYLKELGFNLNFAPVADVITDMENPVLGSRSFGTDVAVAANMVFNVVEGMQNAGVNACLKHFPGMGSAEEDTHDGRVEITRTLEEMRASDFIPFQSGIEAGAKIIMVSHVTASAIDSEGLPSSLSRVVITDVLRGELGFEGVVVTDALDMSAVSEYYTSEEAAIMAIKAGADMLLMPENFEEAYNGILTAVQQGKISEERINESLRRIYRIKYADKLE